MPDDLVPDIDSHIGVQLRYAYQRATANLTDAIRELGLTPMQVSVLARLAQRGPTTQNLLGRSLAMEPANVRDVVQRLRRRGLVSLDPTPRDRRALVVSLTDAGQDLVEQVWPLADEANERTLSRLTPTQRHTLIELLLIISEESDEQSWEPGVPARRHLRSEVFGSPTARTARRATS